jgi:hypothetical protein
MRLDRLDAVVHRAVDRERGEMTLALILALLLALELVRLLRDVLRP